VGLAAPQIGAMRRLAVVDCSPDRRAPVFLANPDIIAASVEMRSHEEASPNLPGISAIIERPGRVTVRFLNRDGVAEERSFTDLWAISVQHQIDHLNGRLYVDHLSQLRRRMLLRKAAKRRPG
jgi:peptide deformylase